MGIEYRDKIMTLMRQKGPLLPSDVARLLKTNTIFAAAMLSEMKDNKFIEISTMKIGGSPLYYLPKSEQQLERFLGSLHEKDRRVFEELKRKGVMKDSEQDLLTRVALRKLKDFAKPFHVSSGEDSDLFWRIYSVSDEQAMRILSGESVQVQPPRPVLERPLRPEPIAPQPPLAKPPVHKPSPPKTELRPALSEGVHAGLSEQSRPKPQRKRQRTPKKPFSPEEDKLFLKAKDFCDSKGIKITDVKIIKRNNDIEFLATIPNPVGETPYFCKVKNKKSISDTDIAALYAQSTIKKIPALLLVKGKLSKKAQESLQSYSSVSVQVLGS